jgi:phytoene desaturase
MDLFAAVGEDVRNHIQITRLDPIARFHWADGSHLDLRAGDDDLLLEVRRFAPGDVFGFKRLLERGRRNWDLGEAFLSHAPEQLMNGGKDGGSTGGGRLASLRMLTVPFRIGMLTRFSRVIDRHIKDQRLRDVLYQYATYSGASPFRAPATLTVIPFVEHYFGGWHIQGGMYRLAEELEQTARRLGVEIRTGAAVKQILIENNSAAGVRLEDGSEIRADAVIANSDVVYTYRQLVPRESRKHYTDSKLNHLDPGGSGVVIMLGVEGTYPQLSHHTKFMPTDYRRGDLNAMFESRTIPRDPCIYVCAPTRTDPSLAPEGCEMLFVLASAPPLPGKSIDWSIEGRRYRDRLLTTLETKFGLTDLQRRIVVERVITPVDFQSMYNANAGSIYGLASNSLRSAFMRPPNRDRDIKHLYLTGSATHPGGGLPLVALSGKIVSELVSEDLGLPS